MHSLDEPTHEPAQGLSRRQLLGRIGGGLAGATLASLGLFPGRSAQAQAGPISLRDLLGRIRAQGCDPSGGIRAHLPAPPSDHPVISIREVARRYAGNYNHCKPLTISATSQPRSGADGIYVSVKGENFTPGGSVNVQLRSESGRNDVRIPSVARPDGTLAAFTALSCLQPEKRFNVWAIDVASGRSAQGGSISYDCAQTPTPTPLPPPTPPVITSVTQSGSTFTVKGTGFLREHRVHIRFANTRTLISSFGATDSDAAGGINANIFLPCDPSVTLMVSANDERTVPTSQDITGLLWSNSYPVTCA